MSLHMIRGEARYHEIAVVLAEKISSGTYAVGEKLHARSNLATTFGVSAETARKAVQVLVELKILEVRHGSGCYVLSKEKAAAFAAQYQDVRSEKKMREELLQILEKQQQDAVRAKAILYDLEASAKKAENILLFTPFTLLIDTTCPHLNESIGALNLWHHTGATVVAIVRGSTTLLSPGPHAILKAGDTIYFVGDAKARQRMEAFFRP